MSLILPSASKHAFPFVRHSTPKQTEIRPSNSYRSSVGNRLAVNLGSNIAFLFSSLLIGALLTPFLVRKLGAASYGMVPLANVMVMYLGLMLTGFNSAVGRFITVAMGRDDLEDARKYFNTALVGGIFAAGAIAAIGFSLSFQIDSILHIPEGQIHETRWLFAGVLGASILATLRTAFGVASYCRNRLDLLNGVGLVEKLTWTGWVVTAFTAGAISLSHVGAGIMVGSVLATALTIYLWRRLTPELGISVARFRWDALRVLLMTGSWGSINAAGSLLFLTIDLIVVNRLFGAEEGGRYAAVMQVTAVLRALAAAASGAFGPTIVQYYARRDQQGLLSYIQKSLRLTGLLLPLPIGIVAGLSQPILTVWLGNDFADISWLLVLSTAHLSVNLAVLPLFHVQTATNHVRTPALVTFSMGVASVGVAVLAGKWQGVAGVAVASALMLTAKNLLFTPIYTAHILAIPRRTFFHGVFICSFLTFTIAAFCFAVSRLWSVATLPRLMTCSIAACVVYAIIVALLLTAQERARVGAFLRNNRFFDAWKKLSER